MEKVKPNSFSSDPIATLNDDCVINSFFAAWFIDLHYWSDILDVMQNNQYQIGIVALKPEDRKIYFNKFYYMWKIFSSKNFIIVIPSCWIMNRQR